MLDRKREKEKRRMRGNVINKKRERNTKKETIDLRE